MERKVRYSPLIDQYRDCDMILNRIKDIVLRGDFTLGRECYEFEEAFSEACNRKHAIGVGSGTDALKLALRASGVNAGDEVITTANSFWAVVGGIKELGAFPRLVDCGRDMQMDCSKIEAAINDKTKAIVPVHLAGNIADMDQIMTIADRHGLVVVEDGCQSQGATRDNNQVGSWGLATAISMHPLKILNIWGDGGVVITDHDDIDDEIRLLRNHGLRDRNTMEIFGYNTRLDTVQAVVGKHILSTVDDIIAKRREFAKLYTDRLNNISGIELPPIDDNVEPSFLYFVIFAEKRDELQNHLQSNGIETKVHYPKPLYCQKALQDIGYKPGDFPETDWQSTKTLSLPVDQHLSKDDINYVISTITSFYEQN